MTSRGGSGSCKSRDRLSFFSLPGEVRNTIYSLLLPTPSSVIPLSREYKNYPIFRGTPYSHTALFLICHQIYHEATSLFYSCNTFSLSRPTQLPLYIRNLTPHTLAQLSHLSISVTLYLSSLSRRGHRRRQSVLKSPTSATKPLSTGVGVGVGRIGTGNPSTSSVLTQNRELKNLSHFNALTLLTISLNIEACDLQRYLAPSHVVELEDLVPASAEITIEVGRCAHCLHWHDSTSNPMASGDVERNRQWWRWRCAPNPVSGLGVTASEELDEEEGGRERPRGRGREWVLTRTIGGREVDSQPFPPTNSNSLGLPTEEPDTASPAPASELLSSCYTCKKSLQITSPTDPSSEPLSVDNPTPSPTTSSTSPSPSSRLGQTCEVCGLVSFCSNLCFAACVEHQHLCVPRPFG